MMNDRQKRILDLVFDPTPTPTLIHERPVQTEFDEEHIGKGEVIAYTCLDKDYKYEIVIWHPRGGFHKSDLLILASNIDLESLAERAMKKGREDLIDRLLAIKKLAKSDLKRVQDLDVLGHAYSPYYGGL